MTEAVDVLVVGGGPAGAAAAIFTARAGLETRVYDRGPSSLRQCAHLSNYLGFPGGIDVDTFDDLTSAHLRAEGATAEKTTVEAVHRRDAGGFRIETQDGTARAERVVAATTETTTYLAPLFDEFERDAVDADGRTPVEGLYVAGPLGGGPDQALVAAGHGARVGHTIAIEAREERGYWPEIAREYYDWTPYESVYEPGWEESAAEWVRGMAPDDRAIADERVESVVESVVAHERESRLDDDEVERRRREAHLALLEHLDDELIREHLAAR